MRSHAQPWQTASLGIRMVSANRIDLDRRSGPDRPEEMDSLVRSAESLLELGVGEIVRAIAES